MHQSNALLQPSSSVSYDPALGAVQIGYREIHGVVPSTREQALLLCWANVFADASLSLDRYHEIVETLGDVGGDGLAIVRLADTPFDRFGNMSEREDLFGDLATIWVAAATGSGDVRGAVFAAVDSNLVSVLVMSAVDAQGDDRAARILERLANAMAARIAELQLPAENNTMGRLPILSDLGGALDHAAIGINRYSAPR